MAVDWFSADRVKLILAIADCRSFSKAAAELGVSQPHVSQQLGKLEKDVGRRLVLRNTRQVSMTREGDAFVLFARSIRTVGDAARRHFAQPLARGPLRVGIRESFRKQVLVPFLGMFLRQFPNFTLELGCDSDVGLVAALEAGRYDIVLPGQRAGDPRGEFLRSFQLDWFGNDRAMRAGDPVSLVIPPARDVTRELALKTLSSHGRSWRVCAESSNPSVLEAATAAGFGVCPMMSEDTHGDCVALDASSGLPPLPHFDIALHRNPDVPDHSAEAIGAFCVLIHSFYERERAPMTAATVADTAPGGLGE